MRKNLLIYLLVITGVLLTYTSECQSIKREFRAVWVATVANIDWPSRPGLSAREQKAEILRILEMYKTMNFNAVILQIRPAADAIYDSGLEPWSKYLNGVQGMSPDPYYDPLAYWIEEAHKRGMELHAWFNPYRIKQNNKKDSLAATHIFNKHPDWGWEYGNKTFFAPDHPKVWDFVNEVVKDVVSRYDIDAVHFDDYFYPYRIPGTPLPDSAAFADRGGVFYPDRIDEWRRHNVDTIIQILSKTIKETKPWVKFGISPFGVWRNSVNDPMGSETSAGTTNYDALYADVIKWQREGWIDYLMPQLYWRESHSAAAYSTLAYWWNDYSYTGSMYYGLAPYRIDRKSEYKEWRRKKYFLRQFEMMRSLENVDGFGFFSSKQFFREDLKWLKRKMKRKYFEYPAIVPRMPQLDAIAPGIPYALKITDHELTWQSPDYENETNRARFYVIYKYNIKEDQRIKHPENILEITGETTISIKKLDAPGVYRISALDRFNNESQLSEKIYIK